jgi:hypothetical protein
VPAAQRAFVGDGGLCWRLVLRCGHTIILAGGMTTRKGWAGETLTTIAQCTCSASTHPPADCTTLAECPVHGDAGGYHLVDLPCGCQDITYPDGTTTREHDHTACDRQPRPH